MTKNSRRLAWLVVVLPIGGFVWLFHGEILWVALQTDYFMKVSGHGYSCSDRLENSSILVAIYTGLFFVCSALYGVGHAFQYAEVDPKSFSKERTRAMQIKMATGVGLAFVFGTACVLTLVRMC